ncbi:MAG: tRNA (N6-isopentenyl adenosine(37)-C2)-methylthiotransferase MiaB [Pseudomonadota bacterium]
MPLPEKFFVETYGCQMNEHDSEQMCELLERQGLGKADAIEQADVIVINTCAIREKAEHKVYSSLGKLKSLKINKPETIIVVAGCVAQQQKQDLLNKFRHLDLVMGTHQISKLPSLVTKIKQKRERISAVEFVNNIESLHMSALRYSSNRVCSYVTIMQGCSNFCSYCVVPYTRGKESSRRLEEILEEVSELASRGIKEITLLGQNVNAYGKDLYNFRRFGDLLQRLSSATGIKRIRFTTSHPKDFDSALVEAISSSEKVCEHMHLPLQSGSDKVLKAMRRGYCFSEYLEKIELLRTKIPTCSMTADIIVGFPGESEDDFEDTMDALRRIRFDQIFSFKYSSRPGTVAEKMPGQIPEETKKERLTKVHAVQDSITETWHKNLEGSIQEVLVEGNGRLLNQFYGRTRTNKIVNFDDDGSISLGDVVRVRVLRGLKHSLLGSIV